MSLLLLLVACLPLEASDAVPPPALADPPPSIEGKTVATAFPPPRGFTSVEHDAFADWIGNLPLEEPEVPVRTHAGAQVGHRARVIDFPMVRGDLQQCADSAIRVRAEYLKEIGAPISFHATSGDPMPWERWQAGERPYESGNRLKWKPGTSGGWDAYLAKVFMWAGTRSLQYDTDAVSHPRPGDVLVSPGSPGHAVLLLDVATRGEETLVLVGEGFMPAQDFHVELGPREGWWPYRDGIALDHWTLPASGLRRWKEPDTGD